MADIKGDLRSRRSIQADRRLDEGFTSETLSGNRTVVRHDYKVLNLDPNGSNRNVTLPDATTLPVGWSLVVRNSGSANSLLIKDNAGTTLKTIALPSPTAEERMYQFILLTNGTAAGTWHVVEMGDPGVVVASRFVVTFSSGDWPAAVSGYRTLTGTEVAGLLASNHGRGTSPMIIIQELSGSDYDRVLLDRERVLSTGNLELRIVDGAEFDGRVVLM